MRRRPPAVAALLLLFTALICTSTNVRAYPSTPQAPFRPVFQKGMQYTGWSRDAYNTSWSDESLGLMRDLGVEWVGINVFWYQTSIYTSDIHADPELTPSNESVVHAIQTAHQLGMKVMLKPMVDPMDGNWRGVIIPTEQWFEAYKRFIFFFAEFAEENDVEMFSIGCELVSTISFTEKWAEIIEGVRERYHGPIVYCANWPNYKLIEWWELVDYVGIDAYFPLTNKTDPTLQELKDAWNRIADDIGEWQATIGKPIIFPEIGYRSLDGANMEPWNWKATGAVDLQEQADCYEAAFQALWNRSWFYGMYWWSWEADPSVGGSGDNGYTPHGKPAEDVIADWYGRPRIDPSSTLAYITMALLNAPENTAYFIFADPNRMTEPVAAYDLAAGGVIYGMCRNPQNVGFDSNGGWVVQSGEDLGRVLLANSTIVLFGGPYPHRCVRYYEEGGVAPVRFLHDLEGGTYNFLVDGEVVASLPADADFNHTDLILVEAFQDGNGNTVYVIYGFTWRGTWAGAVYFKEHMYGKLNEYTGSYYILRWLDANGDGMPQTPEIMRVAPE